ncbi:MAG: hypothetical protein DCF16_14795 [Alphaproteobacteria bacterium]|nr:MAG: hypothetical protein DCF16_14795 [Alphaproteobacteria bacterium]
MGAGQRVVAFLGHDPTAPSSSGGERLRAARRRQGLSLKALARALPCDEATVTKWEANCAKPRLPQAQALDGLLGTDWRGPATGD